MRMGVVAVPVTSRGEILVLPHVTELVDKKELVIGSELPMQEVIGYEFPAGAVEPGEDKWWAIARETWEEAGLLAAFSQLNEVNYGVGVRQERGERTVDFGVIVFKLILSELQEKYMRLVKGAKNIQDFPPDDLRPRDRAIAQLIREVGE